MVNGEIGAFALTEPGAGSDAGAGTALAKREGEEYVVNGTNASSAMVATRGCMSLFVYRIGRELGSLAAALGGLDALVFTAGIGEHAAEIRRRVCEQSAWLGVDLDEAANAAGGPRITTAGSSASAWAREPTASPNAC
jgi:acetate kinase